MSSTIAFHRQIEVRHEVDVFVAGGGPAGVAAAVAAARQGARVFLAEGQACLGGMGTAGLVPAWMTFGDGERFLAAGVGEEVLDRTHAAGGTSSRYDPARKHGGGADINAEVLKRVYDDMLVEAGVGFAFHTAMIDVLADGGRVTAAVCAAKSGLFAVKARMYVDGTGDGDLAAWAGAPFEKGDEHGRMMPGTLCQLWANVDWPTYLAEGKPRVGEQLPGALDDGVIEQYDLHLPGLWQVSETLGGGNVGHTFGVDGTDERSLTEALIFGRRLIPQYERFYKEYVRAGLERMELAATGSLLGLRETRRILGDYVLCLDDFKRRAVFDDEIGRYCYPVDIHPLKPGKAEFERFHAEWTALRCGPGESYGIPYRILLPRKLDNVLVAGRCVSTDRSLQGSLRVMPGCYITGQAAGVAAAMAADAGGEADARAVHVKALQRRLVALGACLPNA